PDQSRMIFVDRDWGGWSWNPSNNTWAHIFRTNGDDGSGLPQYMISSYPTFAVYSKLGFLVFGGGSSVYKMDSAGVVTTIPVPPFGSWVSGPGGSGNCCSSVQDPATGHIVIIDASSKIWDLDPTTGVYTNTGTAPSYFGINGGPAEGL